LASNLHHCGAAGQGWLETAGFCDGDRPHLSPCEWDARPLVRCRRIGLCQGQDLPWRWYLRASRSVSRRPLGDRRPGLDLALNPKPDQAACLFPLTPRARIPADH